MKHSIIVSLIIVFALPSYGQNEKSTTALQAIQHHYNAAQYDSIYPMLSTSFQQKVSKSALSQLFARYQNNFGAWQQFSFLEGQEGRDTFLAEFEMGQQQVGIYIDKEGFIAGLLFKPVESDDPPKFERNTTKLQLPFKGVWFTVWGGTTKMQNYHVISRAQQGAFDFLIIGENGRSYARSGTRNEDYYAFGQPLYAVCDATVHDVITGIEDNRPGIMNSAQPLGNSVTLVTDKGEYFVYAHFEAGSVSVKKGDQVKKGQYLGNCGNSGNSSEAHLHLHLQDGPNEMTAAGARCFFEEVVVNGQLETDYSPVRLDRISRPE